MKRRISPFPGIDHFLEGSLWPDVHLGLSFVIKEQLAAVIGSNYVVRTATYTVEDTSPEEEIGIMYPDVEILRRENRLQSIEMGEDTGVLVLTPPSLLLEEAISPVEVRVPFIEIRDRQNNRLITAIEVLSPVNKRAPGLKPYRQKRKRLHEGGVHLLEIDLLRRGERVFKHPFLPKCHYLITLTRAESEKSEIWTLQFEDKLPVVPVPLKAPDTDISLSLGKALDTLYERSRYDLSIDYAEMPPPPNISEKEKEWIKALI